MTKVLLCLAAMAAACRRSFWVTNVASKITLSSCCTSSSACRNISLYTSSRLLIFDATFSSKMSSFLRTSSRIKSVRRIRYPLICAISWDVSVFQLPGSPQVISRVSGFNSVLTNSAKRSFIWTPTRLIVIKLRQSKIKPLLQSTNDA